MSRLIIAVDIDDVLVESGPAIIKFYNSRWGTNVKSNDFYAIHDSKAWGADEATAIRRVEEFVMSSGFIDLEPTQEAMRCISDIAQKHELHVLTGRPDTIAVATKDWLQKYFPDIFASANFSNLYNEKMRSKGEMCSELNVQYLIDDHVKHLFSAQEYGIKGVLFGDYPWNRVDKLPDGMVRCKDWREVQEYFDGLS